MHGFLQDGAQHPVQDVGRLRSPFDAHAPSALERHAITPREVALWRCGAQPIRIGPLPPCTWLVRKGSVSVAPGGWGLIGISPSRVARTVMGQWVYPQGCGG